ncbi:MAG: murein L,D-transpeptidase catalytic domain family protein [Legionellales bacterium]|nr:murein L,D-transpeptidase catalytic domain family protein [Legionellales bacterium]
MRSYFSLFALAFLTTNLVTNSTSFATSFDVNAKANSLSTKAPKLNLSVLKLALSAYNKAKIKGDVKKPLLAVIDYSLPSSKQRLWIFDLRRNRLLYNTYVAHGVNSGDVTPRHFSNQASSRASSIGTYVTESTYTGSNGLSLNLIGLEKGFNDNAYNRRVVMHGAWYVDPNFIQKSGRAGRSWGCPSISQALAKPVINLLKNGSVLFAYYPDRNYLSQSHYAHIA